MKVLIKRNLGVYYMIIASLFFAFTGAFGKALSAGGMSSVEVAFFRNIVGLIIVSWAIYKLGHVSKGGRPILLALRGVVGAISMLALFYNIATIGLAESFTFAKMSTIFIAIFGAVLFKERIGFWVWFGIIVGFLGIVLIMQPNIGFEKSDFTGILNAVLAAVAYMSVYELKKYYDTKIIVFSFVFAGTVLPLFCMGVAEFFIIPSNLDFLFAKFIMPNLIMWVYILLMGICGFGFQAYMTKAYATTKKAGTIAAISYVDILFSLIIGIIMGDSLPNLLAFFGIILVIVSGIIVATQKNK